MCVCIHLLREEHMCVCLYVPYSGRLSREKTFVNFAVLCLLAKVLSATV